MRLATVAIILLINLVNSLGTNVSGRDVFLLQKRMSKLYPLFCKKYCFLYDPHNFKDLTFFNTFSSLELPSDPPFVIKEFNDIIFKMGNHRNIPLDLLRAFEGDILQEAIKGLTFAEAAAILKLEEEEGNFIKIEKIVADNRFKKAPSLSLRLLWSPRFDKIQHFIDQGVSWDILKKLLSSEITVFLENAHLDLWKGPLGELLLAYVQDGHLKYYDSYTLDYLEKNEAAQSWIVLAESEGFSTEKIVLMLDFPERAAFIYERPVVEALKGIFMDNISDWRRKFADKINWEGAEWQNRMRKKIQMVSSLSPFKEDLFFDALILYSNSHSLRLMFGPKYIYRGLQKDYLYKKAINERQELVYLHLKNKGYPIQDIFTTPNDKLENEIWEHFKVVAANKRMDWLKFRTLQIVCDKRALSCSRIALGKNFLAAQYLEKCSDNERINLFSSLNAQLNEYLEEDIRVHIKEDCGCDGFSCLCDIFPNRQIYSYLCGFKKKYLSEIDVEEFYPKLIKKLKQERDPISRSLLYEILEISAFKRLGPQYKEGFEIIGWDFNIFHGIEESAQVQNWTSSIQDLAENIRQLYLSHHPWDVLDCTSFNELVKADESLVRFLNLDFNRLGNINF